MAVEVIKRFTCSRCGVQQVLEGASAYPERWGYIESFYSPTGHRLHLCQPCNARIMDPPRKPAELLVLNATEESCP